MLKENHPPFYLTDYYKVRAPRISGFISNEKVISEKQMKTGVRFPPRIIMKDTKGNIIFKNQRDITTCWQSVFYDKRYFFLYRVRIKKTSPAEYMMPFIRYKREIYYGYRVNLHHDLYQYVNSRKIKFKLYKKILTQLCIFLYLLVNAVVYPYWAFYFDIISYRYFEYSFWKTLEQEPMELVLEVKKPPQKRFILQISRWAVQDLIEYEKGFGAVFKEKIKEKKISLLDIFAFTRRLDYILEKKWSVNLFLIPLFGMGNFYYSTFMLLGGYFYQKYNRILTKCKSFLDHSIHVLLPMFGGRSVVEKEILLKEFLLQLNNIIFSLLYFKETKDKMKEENLRKFKNKFIVIRCFKKVRFFWRLFSFLFKSSFLFLFTVEIVSSVLSLISTILEECLRFF